MFSDPSESILFEMLHRISQSSIGDELDTPRGIVVVTEGAPEKARQALIYIRDGYLPSESLALAAQLVSH